MARDNIDDPQQKRPLKRVQLGRDNTILSINGHYALQLDRDNIDYPQHWWPLKHSQSGRERVAIEQISRRLDAMNIVGRQVINAAIKSSR